MIQHHSLDILLYCPQCQRHTPHERLVDIYATRCDVCNCQTNQLMRLLDEQYIFTAPDGTKAIVVENKPDSVTFYVADGEHQGYYHHNKLTGENRVVQG